MKFLDLKPRIDDEYHALSDAFRRVVISGQFIRAREVGLFEEEFAAYCGTTHCVGVGNGLDALTLSLMAAGIGKGDEVLVAANAYWATWLAIERCGATVRPVDAEPMQGNIDPEAAAAAVTSRTAAIMALHLYGQPVHPAIVTLARRKRLLLVEDAAHAHGARLGKVRAGAIGDVAAFSFYPTKTLGALGDAGAVTTSDARIAARVRRLANYGSNRKHHFVDFGINSRLDEMQAAFLRVSLARLDTEHARRRALAQRYLYALAGLPDLALPVVPSGYLHGWHLFVVHHPRRDRLRKRLAALGIATEVHYPIPPYRQKPYAGRWRAGRFPVSDRLAATCLSLPLYPGLGVELGRVSATIKEVL